MQIGAQFKGWLTWNGEFFLGPRYIRLLQSIEETGTIRDASERVGLSYRTCLTRVRRMEAVAGQRVVETTRGGTERGSARLTSFGKALVAVYDDWRVAVQRSSDETFARVVLRLIDVADAGPATPRPSRRARRKPNGER